MEEVDCESNFRQDKVAAGPEHDMGEMEKVEEDEMGPDCACGFDADGIIEKEMPDVADLANEEGDPIYCDELMPDCERSGVRIGLAKSGTGMTVVVADRVVGVGTVHVGGVICVVECGDQGEEPGEDSEDLIGDDVGSGDFIASGEGVVCWDGG